MYHRDKFSNELDLKLPEGVLRPHRLRLVQTLAPSGRIGYRAREYARAVLSKTTAQVKQILTLWCACLILTILRYPNDHRGVLVLYRRYVIATSGFCSRWCEIHAWLARPCVRRYWRIYLCRRPVHLVLLVVSATCSLCWAITGIKRRIFCLATFHLRHSVHLSGVGSSST